MKKESDILQTELVLKNNYIFESQFDQSFDFGSSLGLESIELHPEFKNIENSIKFFETLLLTNFQ